MDLPEPVVPATNTCGNSSKSAPMHLPSMFFPNITANGCSLTSGNCSNTSLKETGVILAFGISKPEYLCPSTTPSNLALTPPKRMEISSTSFSTDLTETLFAYSILYLVTDGPTT